MCLRKKFITQVTVCKSLGSLILSFATLQYRSKFPWVLNKIKPYHSFYMSMSLLTVFTRVNEDKGSLFSVPYSTYSWCLHSSSPSVPSLLVALSYPFSGITLKTSFLILSVPFGRNLTNQTY